MKDLTDGYHAKVEAAAEALALDEAETSMERAAAIERFAALAHEAVDRFAGLAKQALEELAAEARGSIDAIVAREREALARHDERVRQAHLAHLASMAARAREFMGEPVVRPEPPAPPAVAAELEASEGETADAGAPDRSEPRRSA